MKPREMVSRVLVLSLLLSVSAFASLSLRAFPPDLGVVVQSASYDPVKHEIAIRFYNSTRHDVTAYHYLLRIDYVDGTAKVEDRGTELAVTTYTGTFLHADSTRDEKLFELPQPQQVARVVGIVDVVAYDDGTAEVTNEAAFNSMVESRKARVAASQKVNELLRQSFSADNPGQDALGKLHELLKTYMDKGTQRDAQDAAMLEQLQMAIQNLGQPQRGPLTSDRLHEYVKQHDDGLAAMKFHSELRRTN